MSMSTRIDDLPGGPINDDVKNDLSKIQDDLRNGQGDVGLQQQQLQQQNYLQQQQQLQQQNYMQQQNYSQLNELNSNQTNIKMDIKKRVHFKEPLEEIKLITDSQESDISLFEYLKLQINEENLLIFIMLILASRSEFDNYTKLLPFVGGYAESSTIISTIIKCLVILIVYIFSKKYLLPSIKL